MLTRKLPKHLFMGIEGRIPHWVRIFLAGLRAGQVSIPTDMQEGRKCVRINGGPLLGGRAGTFRGEAGEKQEYTNRK